jgi:hypothetical protein
MKTHAALATTIAALAALPALAAAQPSAAPPPPPGGGGYYAGQPAAPTGGFHQRQGRPMIGFGIGLGNLQIDDNDVGCPSCDYDPVAFEGDFHIGGMLSPRFGLMLELQANGQVVDETSYGPTTLTQVTAMVAGQYWVSPRLWIKGGIGAAHLAFDYNDGYESEPIDDGAAVMAAVGYELVSARRFGLDLQGRVVSGSYDGIDQNITSATVGLGFSWYGLGSGGAVIVVH